MLNTNTMYSKWTLGGAVFHGIYMEYIVLTPQNSWNTVFMYCNSLYSTCRTTTHPEVLASDPTEMDGDTHRRTVIMRGLRGGRRPWRRRAEQLACVRTRGLHPTSVRASYSIGRGVELSTCRVDSTSHFRLVEKGDLRKKRFGTPSKAGSAALLGRRPLTVPAAPPSITSENLSDGCRRSAVRGPG